MIIFLYGADAYRSKQKLDEIVSQYKSVRKSGLNLKYLDASESDFSDFYNHFKVASMFAETKLVIVKNLFENKKFQEAFLAELKNLESLKDVILLYEKEEPDQRLKIFKTLTKECKCRNLNYWKVQVCELGCKTNSARKKLTKMRWRYWCNMLEMIYGNFLAKLKS
jgi:DNA polymerase III delta subunit